MNVYRSFGNLMEAWVTEEGRSSYPELLRSNDEASPSPPTNLRSESVDSGVEMASPDMSFPATCSSVSTDPTELDGFTADQEGSSGTWESSVHSCPSPSMPCLPPNGAQDHTILHQKVEAALQRSNSKHLKDNPAVELRRRRSRVHPRPVSESLRGQRSDRFDLRRMFDPSEPMRLTRQHRSSVASDTLAFQRKLEDLSEDEGKGLSPGLSYLEQVCQMLEEFARQQRRSRALQTLEARQAEPALEVSRQEQGSHRRPPHRHLRQRSASDTNIATSHLRMKDTACRGQHPSTDDLLMELNEDLEKQGTEDKKRIAPNRSWKTKIGSLTRNLSVLRDVKSQQMQSAEKKQTRLRLSQLFRRNRKRSMSQ